MEGSPYIPIYLILYLHLYRISTTGGSGGTVTTVTSLDALTSAVKGNDPKIVIISGTITGSDGAVVKVGSNTSVLGKSGASEWEKKLLKYFGCLTHLVKNSSELDSVS